ncbi:S8 family peptidase [Pontibacter sp. CAU 1760]
MKKRPYKSYPTPQPGWKKAKAPAYVRFIVQVSLVPMLQEYTLSLIQQKLKGSMCKPLITGQFGSRLSTYWVVDIPSVSDPWQIARQLEQVDGVVDAEPDLPRYTSVGGPEDPASNETPPQAITGTRAGQRGGTAPDVYDWSASPYIGNHNSATPEGRAKIRRWNHEAVNFSGQEVAKLLGQAGLRALASLKLAQFDTGYTGHSKVAGGFNLLHDYDAVDHDWEARDEPSPWGFLKNYGHGTRTGSILIGVENSRVPPAQEGNVGLLKTMAGNIPGAVQITPFRVARSVVLLHRISDLIRAVSQAMSSGYQVMTLSMGILPGNAALYNLARTAYERGVIWCCAAGNVVQVVVAPAKYPGVIAVAASNPNDAPWPGSCRGPEVDITAPGQFIYVPVLTDNLRESMAYGNGTSYATPHVAAAAMFWLAKHKQATAAAYTQPWQKVEAFRYCLQVSARQTPQLPSSQFGAGVLDISALLQTPLPAPYQLTHAYLGTRGDEKPALKEPLAAREMAYKDWHTVLAKPQGRSRTANLMQEPVHAGGMARSREAEHFASLLEHKLGRGTTGRRTMSGEAPLIDSAAAFARLVALQELEYQGKPSYMTDTPI